MTCSHDHAGGYSKSEIVVADTLFFQDVRRDVRGTIRIGQQLLQSLGPPEDLK
jgi:hypothetical protein